MSVVLFFSAQLGSQLESEGKDKQSACDEERDGLADFVVLVFVFLLLLLRAVVAVKLCVNVGGSVYLADKGADAGSDHFAGQWARRVVLSSMREGTVEGVLEGRVRCQVSSELCVCAVGVLAVLVGDDVEDTFLCCARLLEGGPAPNGRILAGEIGDDDGVDNRAVGGL